MGDDHLMSLQPGTVISGRYEVVKCLGAGSMGLVYACRHRELGGHLVAIKVLFPEVAQDKVAAARFRNEIFASYGVSHNNVVRAYEYLREGDLIAYTMEFVGGGDLADRLGKPGKLMPIDEIVRLLKQMCAGVQAIHDAGIVHRDLKPENILLTTENQVKIADFGIARTGYGPKLTEHGGVVGTIDYVSPEYMLNSQVDWRSDIYALGVLAFEMITGESPFRGDSVYATMTKRLKEDPPPPSTLRPECPRELDRIVLKAMVRDPAYRYQNACEIERDLNTLGLGDYSAASGFGAIESDRASSGGANTPGHKESAPKAAVMEPPLFAEAKKSGAPAANAASQAARQSPVRDLSSEQARSSSGAQTASKSPKSSSTPRPDSVRTSVIRSERVSGSAKSPREDRLPRESSRADSYEGTQVINPEIFELASAFDTSATHEPVKMERILSRRSGSSGEWEQRSLQRAPQLVTGGIDDNRMRTLSQAVDRRARPIWLDIFLVIAMVIVGIGFGFAILNFAAPEIFNRDIKRPQVGGF